MSSIPTQPPAMQSAADHPWLPPICTVPKTYPAAPPSSSSSTTTTRSQQSRRPSTRRSQTSTTPRPRSQGRSGRGSHPLPAGPGVAPASAFGSDTPLLAEGRAQLFQFAASNITQSDGDLPTQLLQELSTLGENHAAPPTVLGSEAQGGSSAHGTSSIMTPLFLMSVIRTALLDILPEI